MDFLGFDGVGQDGDDVAQPTLAQGEEPGDDLGMEARAGPARRYDEEAGKLIGASRLEVDQGRGNLSRQRPKGLRVKGRSPNRRRRSRRQERAGPDKVLFHAAIFAWTSATCVAL